MAVSMPQFSPLFIPPDISARTCGDRGCEGYDTHHFSDNCRQSLFLLLLLLLLLFVGERACLSLVAVFPIVRNDL